MRQMLVDTDSGSILHVQCPRGHVSARAFAPVGSRINTKRCSTARHTSMEHIGEVHQRTWLPSIDALNPATATPLRRPTVDRGCGWPRRTRSISSCDWRRCPLFAALTTTSEEESFPT